MERGFREKDVIIVDHHVNQPCERQYTQVNCLPYGHDRMSAAGVSYLIAKQMDGANIDLAQTRCHRQCRGYDGAGEVRLVGPVRDIIVEDGVRHQSVEVRKKDLNCYGTATRPLYLSLAYNDESLHQRDQQ